MRYILFIKKECPFCTLAQNLLEINDLEHSVVNFDANQATVLDEIKKAYEWDTVPMIFLRDGNDIEFIGGYSDLVKCLNKNE